MLVEIPDPEVILGVALAFFVGLVGLYVFYKIQPIIKSRNESPDASQSERLEYYERQLIDMKIRLDALEIQGIEQKSPDSSLEIKEYLEKLMKSEGVESNDRQEIEAKISQKKPAFTPKVSQIEHANPVDHVLHLITNKAMTSRDIQVTLQRSREHTSRLMKKLFEDGYVQRNTNTKPYTYSITEKGKGKIKEVELSPSIS